MPRRKILTAQERSTLTEPPTDRALLVRHYTLTDEELTWINGCRGDQNRLGFAVNLAMMKYPGFPLPIDAMPSPALLGFVGQQIGVPPQRFVEYAGRQQTRREHIGELQSLLKVRPYRDSVDRTAALVCLQDLALQTDRGMTIATTLVGYFREWRLLLPSADMIESICAEAITSGERRLFETLTSKLTPLQTAELERLLEFSRERGMTGVTWLRQTFMKASPANILSHVERLNYLEKLAIPATLRRKVPENRLRKLARITAKASVHGMRKMDPQRSKAMMVAFLLETRARILDEVIGLFFRHIGQLHQSAKRRCDEQFVDARKSVKPNTALLIRLIRVLKKCRREKSDPFEAIEKFISWDELSKIEETAEQFLESSSFEALPLVKSGFRKLHRYSGLLLEAVELQAAPVAQDIYDGVMAVKRMHRHQVADASLPKEFVKGDWRPLVFSNGEIDREYYEICAMSELRSAIARGDIAVIGSRLFRDFEEYLMPRDQFGSLRASNGLRLSIDTCCRTYLAAMRVKLATELKRVNDRAKSGDLPGVTMTKTGFKVARLDNTEPPEADDLGRKIYGCFPRVKITDILLDVERWVGLSKFFCHVKTGLPAPNIQRLLTVLLAEGNNLGMTRMAEACPGTPNAPGPTYDNLEHIRDRYLSDEAYHAALGAVVNAGMKTPNSSRWGSGTTSSSDGQWFPTAGRGFDSGTFNRHRGSEPGVTIYSSVNDQYMVYHAKVITGSAHEAVHSIDGLLYHESETTIKEHYTDTGGYSDHVFGLAPWYGFEFGARIRDLSGKNLYVPAELKGLEAIEHLICREQPIDFELIEEQWDEILRLAASIRQGTVLASVILRKLSGYPRQNRLALALREFGRIHRTLFMLKWLSDADYRRQVNHGLNKGESYHTLCRALLVYQAGEIRDRTLENQIHRANGLTLLAASITFWNTVYLDHVLKYLEKKGQTVDPDLVRHVSPLGWKHIAMTGDYVWQSDYPVSSAGLRPLRETELSVNDVT